jgi:hypothetical protein
LREKAGLLEAVQAAEAELKRLRAERRTHPAKHPAELPEEWRSSQLLPPNKMLTDSVRMIACRAETALAARLMPHLKKEEEARGLARKLPASAVGIQPNPDARALTIRIHRMACPRPRQDHCRTPPRLRRTGIPPP